MWYGSALLNSCISSKTSFGDCRKLTRKLILFSGFAICCMSTAYGQWATSGNNMYNTNTGYVGIGTTSPWTPLDILSGVNMSLTSTEHAGAIYLGLTNDYGSGAAAQYVLLLPFYGGTSGENDAGLSGILRAYRGNTVSYNVPEEYTIMAQTAYASTSANMTPRGFGGPVNIYSVTYMGNPYLAVLGSDLSASGSQWTFTGYYWNDVNSFKPQIVLASQCSNVNVFQNTSYIAGPYLNANVNGNVGAGTGVTNPQASLHVGGEAVSPDVD